MGLELLSMTVFWVWQAIQPVPPAEVPVVPTKQILQATWYEPVSLRDESSPPEVRKPAVAKKPSRLAAQRAAKTQKPQKPLWSAAKSWELPPILWAGFEAFVAVGLGIVSVIKP